MSAHARLYACVHVCILLCLFVSCLCVSPTRDSLLSSGWHYSFAELTVGIFSL